MVGTRKLTIRLAAGLLILACWAVSQAAGEGGGELSDRGDGLQTADVVVDGQVVMSVRGISGYPAERRAAEIAERIIAIARDDGIAAGDIVTREVADAVQILAGDRQIGEVFDVDAEVERIDRKLLAETVLLRVREAVVAYRYDRSPPVLLRESLYALAATLFAMGLGFGFRRGFRGLDGLLAQRLKDQLEALEAQSASFVKAQQLAKFLRGLVKGAYLLLMALTLYFYLHFLLGLYPWTRGFAVWLFDLILTPLRSMGEAILETIPDLVFLVLLFYLTRYILRMIRAFFEGIATGAIELASFEREWAWPTYRILRFLVVIFALVVAYPYIPGSESAAFKGISILLGLIVSLGSSSIISNIIAGYSLAYRRPFSIGDRVRIGDTVGDVMETRVLVTRLRSLKNEEVVVPNTAILNGEVVNYSSLSRQQGLILHTRVGIGYETPWRQVEAMLKLAADRTSGLLKKPKPFVLQTALGDFAVTYELNAWCADPKNTPEINSALHRNILDLFNEHGVAIMTPAYVADPAEPKLVPRDQWYAPPAPPAPPSPVSKG